jgi:uncharacterized protein (DUF608 family)
MDSGHGQKHNGSSPLPYGETHDPSPAVRRGTSGSIFPDSVPTDQWTEFSADGFADRVSGIVFEAGQPRTGVPLGGIGTGWVDLNTDGLLGRTSIFNSFAPPRTLNLPFLGVAIAEKSYCLTSAKIAGTRTCRRLRYWGHYPVADLEFEIDEPLRISLRAWAPFFPGNAPRSNCPAVLFEVRLHSQSPLPQRVSIVAAFPGPSAEESGARTYSHVPVHSEDLNGVGVHWSGGNYTLSCPGRASLTTGGFVADEAWAEIGRGLPASNLYHPGASLRVELLLDAAAVEEVQVVLAWHVPRWSGTSAHSYRHAYADRFSDAETAAAAILRHRASWRSRIFAWQQEIYAEANTPIWLRDQLVNVLHTIARDSFWASDSIPRQNWYGPVGLFGLTESPRTTPHVCNPSDWYGGLPIVFFFPELMASLLRMYVHFQLSDGEVPLGVGDRADFAGQPVYQIMHPMNSCVHIHLIDRLWQRDGDLRILEEFYPSARRALAYMQQLAEGQQSGLPKLDADPLPNQFYGDWPWYGLSIHVGGFWLGAISMMARMASAIGDSETEARCQDWSRRASHAVEETLWDRGAYLLYREPESERQSDSLLANQLVGQWCSRLHGLERLTPEDRARQTLESVLLSCGSLTAAGLLNAAKRNGGTEESGGRQSSGIFTGECLVTASTLIYEGRREVGLEIARRLMDAIVRANGAGWELPNILDAEGKILHGDDFYQMMILWSLPLALHGQGIREASTPGNLISRILASSGAWE